MNKQVYDQFLNKGFCEINNKDTAILLLHGYAQTSKIYAPYIEQLKEYGDVFAPTLRGHFESNIVDIKDHKELLFPNYGLYKLLKENYKKVILIGYSLGGIISLYLSEKINPDKLILISTPINYNREEFIISARYLINNLKNIRKDNRKPSIIKYLEMYKLSLEAKKKLFQVKCDTLFIHGKIDNFVMINQSYFILENINSRRKEINILEGINHYVLEHFDKVIPIIIEYIIRK